ncbi:MAG TPA: extracellular solute-binding protein [Gemmataceae bacterium]|nr:extracellular solute-binding protein [Gemmataceae bacterium]
MSNNPNNRPRARAKGQAKPRRWRSGLVVVALAALAAAGCESSAKSRVTLYCAQDKEFAEETLAKFTERTGLKVLPKFDTEADKSVSLYLELVREKDRPRCDVFWNNEILSTIRLQKQGMLEPYDSPAAKPYPEWAKAKDRTWHAFAARARVLIVNTDLVPEVERPKGLRELTQPRWKGRVVMARPQFGTSATMAACLFQALGQEQARAFYLGLKENGVQIAPGNKQVAEWVAAGRSPGGQKAAVGITDTDDALDQVKAGKRVAMIFPDRGKDDIGTLFIPNTVAILKGDPNPDGARKLVDYLLSPEVEARLAESESAQIPLNPEVKARPPKEIETPATVKAMAVDWEKAAALWDEVQDFLQEEFAR